MLKDQLCLFLIFTIAFSQAQTAGDTTLPPGSPTKSAGDAQDPADPNGPELGDRAAAASAGAADTTGTNPTNPTGTYRNGMTWGYGGYTEIAQETFRVHCFGSPTVPPYAPYTGSSGGCNAYKGDTPCNHSLPILCINKCKYSRPCYPVDCRSYAMTGEFYCGWSEGFIILSRPVLGYSLSSQADGDKICMSQFGTGFRMAEHHDGRWVLGMSDTKYCYNTWPSTSYSGGWGFVSYGVKGPTWTRFWVAINDQAANCWDP
jgi:hypothetical protein